MMTEKTTSCLLLSGAACQSLKILLLFWILINVKQTEGTGSLSIRLLSYEFEYDGSASSDTNGLSIPVDQVTNYTSQWRLSKIFQRDNTEGSGQQREPVDAVDGIDWPWTQATECSGMTQYRFLICLDYDDEYDPQRPCALERIQTEQISVDRSLFRPPTIGREVVTFNSFLGTRDRIDLIPNPFEVEFPIWKGPVRIAVYVRCCSAQEQHADECEEVLSTTVSAWPRSFIDGSQTLRYFLTGRGSLSLSASANCKPNYFGQNCDIHCKVENAAIEHTFCNSTTGQLQCLAGWEGPDCQTDIDECNRLGCKNGATCRNNKGSFTCMCQIGTRGRLCEQRYPICHLNPCNHQGTCVDTMSGTFCFCMPGFKGQWCHLLEGQEEKVDPGSAGVTAAAHTTPVIVDAISVATANIQVRPSRRSTAAPARKTEDSQWHHWYIALILGIMLLLAIIIIAVVFAWRAKVKMRYDITEPLPPPPPVDASPSPQPKVRGFNNEAYQVDDPTNIIMPTSFQIIYNHRAGAMEASNLNSSNSNNKVSAVNQQQGAQHGPGNWKEDYNDKVMLPTKGPGAKPKGKNLQTAGASSEAFEMTEYNGKGKSNHKSSPMDNNGFDKSNKKKINKDEGNPKNSKDQGKGQTALQTTQLYNGDDEDDDDHGFRRRDKRLDKTQPSTSSFVPGEQQSNEHLRGVHAAWAATSNQNYDRDFGTSSGGSRATGRQQWNDQTGRSQRQEENHFINGMGTGRGTEMRRQGNKYATMGRRQSEHVYEDIDTESAFHIYRPVPKPRSIHNVGSQVLQPSDIMNDQTLAVRNGNHSYSPRGDRYDQLLPSPVPTKNDPSVVLGVRRGSEGCITESSFKPVSIRYDYPRYSDGNVKYLNENDFQSSKSPFGDGHDSCGGPDQRPQTFPSVFKSHYANQPNGVFSVSAGMDKNNMYQNTGSNNYNQSMTKDANTSLQNGKSGGNAQAGDSPYRPHNYQKYHSPPRSHKPISGGTSKERPRYANTSLIPAARMNSRGYVSNMDVGFMSDTQASNFNKGSSFDRDPPNVLNGYPDPTRGSQRRRKSEPFADKLFRRRRTSELRGEDEKAIDVDWWDEDERGGESFEVDTTGAYSVSPLYRV